ncbi:hypothetical protein [Aliiroseovarius lamellibrachiae]|uniref:hypothetical protein n=1 Tax=Aliiroseovarius lamellibrachiae TaxID=1924933 RepID=UPI001BDF9603|nr:hypothetical protein [Aliiroseovarius lamellibrachiae]MBT2130634.1 hypothetical protein [Aliiroseovarius lamellibrachiae]
MEGSIMVEGKDNFSLRYIGERFQGARLPLDVLADLPALRDLIAALAKQEFRQKNPDRKRVPQGFDKSISFSLTDIEDGSAVPVFKLESEVAQQNLPNIGDGMEEIVSRAYKRVAAIVDDAANDIYPQALPDDAIRALSKLGANIQDAEKIELQGTAGADGNVVFLDAYRRKNLLTHIRETYTIEFEGIGELTGVDATHNTIQIKTEQHGEMRLQLDGVSMPAEQFDGNLFSFVEFSASIALDAHDDFKGVEAVHSVDLIRPHDEEVLRCVRRLQELSKIEKGWLGPDHGERLVHLAGTRAMQLVFMRANFARWFKIFPTEDGGLSIEFDHEEWSYAVEISPDGELEIDASSTDAQDYGPESFEGLTPEFFKAFDEMTANIDHDED